MPPVHHRRIESKIRALAPLCALAAVCALFPPATTRANPTIAAVNCGDRSAETLDDGSRYHSDRAYGPNDFGYIGGKRSCPPLFFPRPFRLNERDPNEMNLHDCTRDGVDGYAFDLDPGLYELTIHLISYDRHGKYDELLDIYVEDELLFPDVDYVLEAGMARAFDLRSLVLVRDGTLNIDFVDTRGNHEVSAIGIRPARRDTTPPADPGHVVAMDTYGGVLVKWDRNEETDFMEYRILRREGGPWSPVLVRRIPMGVVPASRPAEYAVVSVDVYGNVSDTVFAGEWGPRNPLDSPLPRYQLFIENQWLHELNYEICEAERCKTEVPGLFFVDGRMFPDVTVSYRGSAQLTAPKKSYNIDLEDNPPLDGASKLALKATFVDPTMQRELGTIDLMDEVGLPHGLTFPVRLELNGEYMGVYLHVERLNEDFLARTGRDPHGRFFRSYGAMTRRGSHARYLEDFESAGVEDWDRRQIIDFVENINTLPDEDILPYLEENLDVESFLGTYAHYIWTSNDDWLDDDYFLYYGAPDYKWTWIPWDVHESWSDTRMDINYGTSESRGSLGEYNRLVDAVLDVPSLNRRYTEKLRSFLEHHLATDSVMATLQWRNDQMLFDLNRDVYKEPREILWRYEEGVQDLVDFVLARGPELEAQLADYELPEYVLVQIGELVPGAGGIVAVEITNLAPRDFDLTGYAVTDDADRPARWPIPAAVIPPRGRLLFQLPEPVGLGGRIALVHTARPAGKVDDVAIPSVLPPGMGFGRYPENSGRWRFLDAPSPGEANTWHCPLVLDAAMENRVVEPGDVISLEISARNQGSYEVQGTLHLDVVDWQHVPVPDNPWATIPLALAPGDSTRIPVQTRLAPGALSPGGYELRLRFVAGVNDEWTRTTLEGFVAGEIGSRVAINEIMARNSSTIRDEAGDYDDWVELLNPTDEFQSLTGFHLTDDYDDAPLQWPLPPRVLAPGERLLVWCDGEPNEGPTHAPFKLASDGEHLTLTYSPDGESVQVVDEYLFGPQETDISIGRYPDANPTWVAMPSPSPLGPNTYQPH